MFPTFTLLELLILASALIIGVTLVAIPRKGEPGYTNILIFAGSMIFGLLLFVPGMITGITQSTLFSSILHLVMLVGPIAVLFFSLEYLYGKRTLINLIIALLAFLPSLIFFSLASRALQNSHIPTESWVSMANTVGIDLFAWFTLVYSAGLYVAALIVISHTLEIKVIHSHNLPVLIILVAGLVAVIVGVAGLSGVLKIPEPTILFLCSSIIGISFLYYRTSYQRNLIGRFFDHKILDHLDDGIIIVNEKDLIVALNSAAGRITRGNLQDSYGKHIDSILPDWQKTIQSKDFEAEREFRGTIFINQERRYISIKVKALRGNVLQNNKKILILRDITELRSTSDARQQEREVMGTFLHSLSIAYKDSKNIREFLERALYQTLYTLNIDSGLIYMLEPAAEPKRKNFSLEAEHGILAELEPLLIKGIPFVMLGSSEERMETVIVSNLKNDDSFSRYIGNIPEDISLAIIPLIVRQEILGMMLLARLQANALSPNDVLRINSAADEIASFIHKQHVEQQQIAYHERIRLVRDLHDSVTQKLYGLVTISEAVKVGLAAGATEKALNLIPKVSENARQALREMRLFLHELDPVDLQKEGLVAALQQRLVAVEGRSDIKAQLISNGEFTFSRETERAIYYIAEEALNNILKHAEHVKSVLVKIRRRNKRVYLDIIDDGCGFDPGVVQSGGRGLRNMKERAAQIGATLKITSGLNKGTRVSLSIQE